MTEDKFILMGLDDEGKNHLDKYFSQYHQDLKISGDKNER